MNDTTFNPNTCDIQDNGNLICDKYTNKEKDVTVEVKGETPKSGTITFQEGNVYEVTLVYNASTTITKDSSGNLVYSEEESGSGLTYTSLGNYEHKTSDGTIEAHDTESGTCSKCGEKVLAPGFYRGDGLFIGWNQMINDGRISVENGVFSASSFQDSYESYEYYGQLVLSDTVNTIDSYSFADSYISSILIPISVITFKEGAFDNLLINLEVNYEGTKDEWKNIENNNIIGGGWINKIHCLDGDITFPANN